MKSGPERRWPCWLCWTCWPCWPCVWLLAVLSLLVASPGFAQTPVPGGNQTAPAVVEEQDAFGRGTPSGTVAGFVRALAESDYETAANFLDLSDLSARRRATVGPVLAQRMQGALDAAGRFERPSQISADPQGRFGDGLPADQEQVGEFGTGDEAAPILLRRIEGEDGPYWVIASDTIDAASAFRRAAPATPLAERWLPDRLTEAELAGAPLAHWLTALAVPLLVFGLAWLVGMGLLLALLKVRGARATSRRLMLAWVAPFALLGAVAAARLSEPWLGVSIIVREAMSWLLEAIGWFALAWLAWRLIDTVADRTLDRLSRKGRASARSVVDFGGRLVKLAVVLVAFVAVLGSVGVDVTAAVAALGIGGLALALGAQRTVENLIASLTIISDRPFRVGDVCRFGTFSGTVEEIGMRSTRIRTLDRTVLTVANSLLAQAEIENLSRRDRYWFHPVLHLAVTTAPAKLRALVEDLHALLAGDERLDGDSVRVRLLVPAQDRLPLEISAYVPIGDFDSFLMIQQGLLLGVLERVAAHGLELAAPPVSLRGQS